MFCLIKKRFCGLIITFDLSELLDSCIPQRLQTAVEHQGGILFNIRKNVVFDRKNVRYARYISWCCFAECAAFFALGFFIPFSFAVSFAAAFIGLIVRVAKNLLNEAVDIKEENDLTV